MNLLTLYSTKANKSLFDEDSQYLLEDCLIEILANHILDPRKLKNYQEYLISQIGSNKNLYKFRHIIRAMNLIISAPELKEFNERMFDFGEAAVSIYYENILKGLLIACEKNSSKGTISILKKYLQQSANPGNYYLAIGGIEIKKPYTLGSNITMLPFENVPSPVKELPKENFLKFILSNQFAVPKVALSKPLSISPKTREMNTNKPFFAPENFYTTESELKKVCLLLTLVKNHAPFPIESWWKLSDKIPISISGGAFHPHFSEILYRTEPEIFSDEDANEARKIISIFSKMLPDEFSKFEIPLERYNQSIRRLKIADKALDLSIAIESIIFPKKESSELRFQFALRSAWFIGENPEDRKKIFNTLKTLYGYRSSTAHTGNINKAQVAIINEGYQIARRIFLKMATSGQPLSWENIVLDVDQE